MSLLLAAAHHDTDLGPLFVILALVAFVVAVVLAAQQQWIGALVAAVVGVIILIYA